MVKEIELEVAEAVQEDIGKGIVRLDSSVIRELELKSGDFVDIVGEKETTALVDRAYPADIGLKIIRMDGLMRYNSKTGIGEKIKVKKAVVKDASSITIAPTQKNMHIELSSDYAQQLLLGRAVRKGDVITLGGTKRRRRAMGDPFQEIFNMMSNDDFLGTSSFGISEVRMVVTNTTPKGATMVTNTTKVNVLNKAVKMEEERVPEIAYEDIGGLSEVIDKIRETAELPLKHPELFQRLGIEPPRGILLYGPPGTGKTLLAKAVANETEANFISINGPEIMSKWVGEAEKKIRDVFEEAEKNAPSIIFIDEIDAIAPKRGETVGEVERRVVAQLLSIMDGLKGRGKVLVMAATNRPNSIDEALRRPGRFDREIEIGVPNKKGRLEILRIHTRNMPLSKDVDLEKMADVTHGFVGADLSALVKEAAINVLRKYVSELREDRLSEELLKKLEVTHEDFTNALKYVRPSAMRELLVEVPNITWDTVGGLQDAKARLQETIEWPLKFPEMFTKLGIKPPRGILLYGPPGTGKTMLAKAVANESDANFISIKGPEIFSKWVGESEKSIREIFRKARQVAPCIIFFDEIDAIAPKRGMYSDSSRVTETVVNQLLTEMDGLEDLNGIVIVGATNRPDILDSSLLRPGRLDSLIHIKAPELETRREILKIHTKNMPLDKDINLDKIAESTDGYSGADLEAVVKESALSALRENMQTEKVKNKHFKKALEKIRPSLNKKVLEFYDKFEDVSKQIKNTEEVKSRNYLG